MQHSRSAAVVAVACAALATARCLAAPPPAAPPRIEVAGTVRFPAEVPTGAGRAIAVDGLSGIAWLGDDRWVVVMDTGAAFVEFSLDLDADGNPGAVGDLRAVRFATPHDYEDVVPCPAGFARGLAAAAHLAVCEEDTPAVHVIDARGAIVGAVPIPEAFARRRPNRGLEALGVSADGAALWTANEEALPADGPPPAPDAGTVVRLVELPHGAAPRRGRQLAYAVDPPHACARAGAGEVFSGVVALVPLPDGQMLVLERSAARCLPPLENRIYVVDPAAAADVADVAGGLAARPDLHAPKRLAWRGGLGCNLEGLALGPSLDSGGTALVAVADAGGLGTPSRLVVLRMLPPVTSP